MALPELKIFNPAEIDAQIEREQSAKMQNKLAELAYGQKQQEINDQNSIRNLLAGANGDKSNALKSLYGAGYYKQAQDMEKAQLDQQKSQADINKTTAEIGKISFETVSKANGLVGSAAYALMQNPNPDHAQTLVANLKKQLPPEISAKMGLDTLQIPTDPAAIKAWANDRYLSSIETDKIMQDATARRNNDQTNATSRANNAATVGATIRGQNLTDARSREQNEQGKWQYDAERGGLVNMKTGEFKQATQNGAPIGAKDKPLTESQGKSTAFASRMQNADGIIGGLIAGGTKTPSLIKQGVESVPLLGGALGAAANYTVASKEQQKMEQAQRDFVNAILRQESGAAISPSEFDSARKQYFPQPGDGRDVIEQKAKNRKIAIEGMKTQAGSGAKSIPGILSSSSGAKQSAGGGWSIQEVK